MFVTSFNVVFPQVDEEEESRTMIPFDQYDFVSDASW